MSKPLLPDELWAVVEPLLPPEPPKPKGGRPRVPDRAALTGILFVLRSGTPWELLPREIGGGSGMTCWRRLRNWQGVGGGGGVGAARRAGGEGRRLRDALLAQAAQLAGGGRVGAPSHRAAGPARARERHQLE